MHCDILISTKSIIFLVLPFRAKKNKVKKKAYYIFISKHRAYKNASCLFLFRIQWCNRNIAGISLKPSETTRGKLAYLRPRFYFLLLEISVKRGILIRGIAEGNAMGSILDITLPRQKEMLLAKKKKAPTVVRRGGKLYEWRYRRKVIWFHANRSPFFRPTTNFASTLSLNNA